MSLVRQSCFAVVAGAWILVCGAVAFAEDAQPGDQPIDFQREVVPIIAKRCHSCHGAESMEGGLRLDTRSGAEKGGHTGASLFAAELDSNAIYLRVTSDDERIRMPKDSEPLSDEEIDVLRRWVLAGAPWPQDSAQTEPALNVSESTESSWGERVLSFFSTWINRVLDKPEEWVFRWFLPVLGIFAFILICEHARSSRAKSKAGNAGEAGNALERLGSVPRSFYPVPVLLFILIAVFTVYQRQLAVATEQLAILEKTLTGPAFAPPTGTPRPVHPGHPKRLGGEYYRGNDERSNRLYNGGFYRTATMRLALCNRDREPLAWGDPVDGTDELLVKLEIERAPFTSEQLFGESVWKNTFLCSAAPMQEIKDPDREIVRFEKTSEVHWVGYYPIQVDVKSAEPTAGIVYLYVDLLIDGVAHAEPHMGIEYSLLIQDGKIDPKSELWMGYIFKSLNVVPDQPGKVPAYQWFGFLPQPEIPSAEEAYR